MNAHRAMFLLLCLMLFSIVAPITANQTDKPQRVKFARGRTTAVLKGSVTERKGKTYVLGAKEGQTMSVHVASKNSTVQFTIATPEPDILTDPTDDFSSELPASGDYEISVMTYEAKAQPYTLEVTIR
jgi:hypothetical protein